GDSHTVGCGDLSTSRSCTNDEVWAKTDNTSAFGPALAHEFEAEYQVIALSGRGVVRNYNGFTGFTLPQIYPYVLFDQQEKYNNAKWKPGVIVVALGTNDFSTPLRAGERWNTPEELSLDYESSYGEFLREIRVKNPDALVIVWA